MNFVLELSGAYLVGFKIGNDVVDRGKGQGSLKAVGLYFVSNEKKKKKLHWSRDRNKGTKFSVIKARNDWGFVLHEGLDR